MEIERKKKKKITQHKAKVNQLEQKHILQIV